MKKVLNCDPICSREVLALELKLKNPFVANHLLRKINKLNGRTTGIEPAHGGFTIHCLDPLGYIRPYTM